MGLDNPLGQIFLSSDVRVRKSLNGIKTMGHFEPFDGLINLDCNNLSITEQQSIDPFMFGANLIIK